MSKIKKRIFTGILTTTITVFLCGCGEAKMTNSELENARAILLNYKSIQRVELLDNGKYEYAQRETTMRTSYAEGKEVVSLCTYSYLNEVDYHNKTTEYSNENGITTKSEFNGSYISSKWSSSDPVLLEEIAEERDAFLKRFAIDASFLNTIISKIDSGKYVGTNASTRKDNLAANTLGPCKLFIRAGIYPIDLHLFEKSYSLSSIDYLYASIENQNGNYIEIVGKINDKNRTARLTLKY